MKKIQIILLTMVIMFILVACKEQHTNTESTNEQRKENVTDSAIAESESIVETIEKEMAEMVLMVNDVIIPVTWEDNDTVAEMKEQLKEGDIVVQMSMYSDNEQVGSLERYYTRNDKQITTKSGDIVLYSGDKIVVFYGSNTWDYTRLGKINLSDAEVSDMLGNGDVVLSITIK
uniref:cyclophilin-like fold protein n=1 Tax=Acetatifactor sp. TaxID=1872090 RepID=UPI0040573D2D